jgi:hypothetical protein
MTGAPVTLLLTDLVDSTGLLQRVADERAQRILHAHRQAAARGACEPRRSRGEVARRRPAHHLRVGGRQRALRGDDGAVGAPAGRRRAARVRLGLHVGGDEVGAGPRARPDRELATSADLGHAGPILDARAHAAYRTRLAELREELAEAED